MEATEIYTVGTVQGCYASKWGTYRATIYYPALLSGKNAPPDSASAPYAAVVFAHGFGVNKALYRWVGKRLASRGYVAVLFSAPSPMSSQIDQWSDGISCGITYLNELSFSESSVLRGMVDSTRIGAMGHSMGGAGAILATARDFRIKALVALAPAYSRIGWFVFAKVLDAAKTIRVPVQIQVGSKDGLAPKDVARRYYVNLPGLAGKEYVEIKDGGHIQFTDSWCVLLSILDPRAKLTADRQHEISGLFFTAWFQYFLHEKVSSETYVFGARAQNALASNRLSVLEWVKPLGSHKEKIGSRDVDRNLTA